MLTKRACVTPASSSVAFDSSENATGVNRTRDSAIDRILFYAAKLPRNAKTGGPFTLVVSAIHCGCDAPEKMLHCTWLKFARLSLFAKGCGTMWSLIFSFEMELFR